MMDVHPSKNRHKNSQQAKCKIKLATPSYHTVKTVMTILTCFKLDFSMLQNMVNSMAVTMTTSLGHLICIDYPETSYLKNVFKNISQAIIVCDASLRKQSV